MFFNPINSLQAALADELQKDYGTLQGFWNTRLIRAQAWAYGVIVRKLAAKGYLLAQIQAWDEGAEFERALTIWRAIVTAPDMQGVDKESVKSLDWREELDDMPGLMVQGVYQYPQGDPGTVGVGDMDTSNDTFVYPPSDPGAAGDFPNEFGNRGTPTTW